MVSAAMSSVLAPGGVGVAGLHGVDDGGQMRGLPSKVLGLVYDEAQVWRELRLQRICSRVSRTDWLRATISICTNAR